jgi:hypothetical protein
MRIKSHQIRDTSIVFIGLLTILLTSQPAYAHTKLLSASPAADSTVENWPTQIILEFDEELQNLGPEKANFLVVNNSVGDQVSETDEIIDGNIHYIHLNKLTGLINSIPFHTVIVSRYISFYEMFPQCSFYQSYVWAHDTMLLPYGCNLTSHQI